ncbi:MAG: YkgJ family cysteine cluster protein [Phycisphaerae bacterium]|nr:YkgJ family cysteine cluster protein [Phycisphaerae bacterium]
MADGKWYREGLRFECTQCGNCCSGAPGYVWLSREETTKIAAFLGIERDRFTREYTRRVGFKVSLIEKRDLDCIFLKRADGLTSCKIHPVRPLQCRTWPFWTYNLRSAKVWAETAENCPGMNCGDVRDFATIEKLRTATKWSDLP